MAYSREIIAYQTHSTDGAQLDLLSDDLERNGWELQGNSSNKYDEVILSHQEINQAISIKKLGNRFEFNLPTSRINDDIQLFNSIYEKLGPSIEKLSNIELIEWRTHYTNGIVRRISTTPHEGVLIFASSKRLKKYYAENDFNYEFPSGIIELLKQNIIIAIECLDYCFTTIIETEKFTAISSDLVNHIEFEEDDELLILNHSQFSMICNYNNGDYSNPKGDIKPIHQKTPRVQKMAISKSGNEDSGELIIQFDNTSQSVKVNHLIQIEDIPKHMTFDI
ncbi:MAG: hypothetical protein AB8F78_02005 [Saprospiraceae bacterium]